MPAKKKTTAPTARRRGKPMMTRAQRKLARSPVTPRMVEARARELALIAGRNSRHVTATDRRTAQRELTGATRARKRSTKPLARRGADWGAPPVATGRRTRRHLPRDVQFSEKLVAEGMA